jgi:hypothetical protein
MSYDVTVCTGGDCPIKENCHRFTAERLGRQDFFWLAALQFRHSKLRILLAAPSYRGGGYPNKGLSHLAKSGLP